MLDDDNLARRIAGYLGRQPQVSARVACQLRHARERALMKTDPQYAWTPLMPWPSLGVGIVFVVLGLAFTTWQLYGPAPDIADLDAELLTAELPPAAYLDPGFARFVSKAGG